MVLTACGLEMNQQRQERVQYGTRLFPIACYQEDLAREPVPWHWHPDLEFGARCGFQDASYFSKTFRERKGDTPSGYRQECKRRVSC